MAKPGDTLENPVTGERIVSIKTALDTGGKLWQAELFIPPYGGKSAVAHFHPLYEERFDVISGLASYWIGGMEKSAKAGNKLVTPRGVPHKHPWRISNGVLHLRQTIELPEADIESLKRVDIFFETLYGLARDGKVKKDGLPQQLQFPVNLYTFHPLAYISGIPVSFQHVLFAILPGAGKLPGKKFRYSAYSGKE